MDAVSQALELIKRFEGCKLQAYKPIPSDPWTVGYGATGLDIGYHTVWTQQQAEEDLKNRVYTIVNQLRQLIRVSLPFNKLAAVISLVYNIGITAFRNSTMLKKINAGDLQGAGAEFSKWVNAGGVRLQGLANRRQAELEVYLK